MWHHGWHADGVNAHQRHLEPQTLQQTQKFDYYNSILCSSQFHWDDCHQLDELEEGVPNLHPIFFVDPSSAAVRSWELVVFAYSILLLWTNWFSAFSRLVVQIIFQLNCCAIVGSGGHRFVGSRAIELDGALWCITQIFGPRERVRVIFLCQLVHLFTFCFVPPVFFLWFAVLRIFPESVQNSCIILTCPIFLLSASLPRGLGLLIQGLLLRFFELREGIPFKSHNSKSIRHRIDFDSAGVWILCGTSNFHKCRTQCLLSNKTNNKSIVLLKWSRIIRSTPHSPCRGSFSSNSHWMGCRRWLASNLLVIHLGEDGFRSDFSVLELVHVLLLPLMSVVILESWSQFCAWWCRRPVQRVSSC